MSSDHPKIFTYADRAELNVAVADNLEANISSALKGNGNANLMLSGGSTPIQAYRELSRRDLDWDNIKVGLVDDRWVPPSHANSNEGMVRRELPSLPRNNLISMWGNTESPFDAIDEIEKRYKKFFRLDVVVLGMGLDGHTASWFPNAKGLDVALDLYGQSSIAGIDATGSEVAGDTPLRMTLTLSAVAKAKQVILLIYGQEKREVLESAMSSDEVSLKLPISHAIRALGDVMSVYYSD